MKKVYDWSDLMGRESLTHIIEPTDSECGAWIKYKDESRNKVLCRDYDYLTSHTFYGGDSTERAMDLLKRYGFFDIEIVTNDNNNRVK